MFKIFLFSLFTTALSNDMLNNYIDYLNEYDKNYNDNEFWSHYNAYRDNVNYINSHNNKTNGYKLGINKFTDMSRKEFNSTYLSNTYYSHERRCLNQSRLLDIPESVDWRANGWVTDVKDQGQCGSCWAFSAIGAIEGYHANITKQLVSLSEQNLLDCSYGFGCEGCNGGWPEAAMRYVINQSGVDTETSYPYTAQDGDSCLYNKTKKGGSIHTTHNITKGDTNELLNSLAKIGPISIAIDAESDFQFYSSGIFNSTSCSSEMLDHAVLAVGYGKTTDGRKYLIVKNSWGKDWGMDGYIYMSLDIPNMCGISSVASYPM
jgi:cathepsin L